jgi:hypothetical protein
MNEPRLEGYISKWDGSWGLVKIPSQAPDWTQKKFFLHASKITEGDPRNGLPCSFVAGPPRYEGELLQALDVQILAAPVAPLKNGGRND